MCGRSVQWVLLTVLLVRQLCEGSAEALQVSTAGELLAAIKQEDVDKVSVHGDIAITSEVTSAYRLPFVLNSNRSLRLAAPVGERHVLDFGGLVRVLFLEPGGSISFKNIVLKGIAPPSAGPDAGLNTALPESPLWPTLHGAQMHKVAFENVELHPFEGNCTPEGVAAQADEIQGLLGDNGTVTVDNVTLSIEGTVMIPTVITTTWSDLPVGTAEYTYTNVTIICLDDPGTFYLPPSSPAPTVTDASNRTAGSPANSTQENGSLASPEPVEGEPQDGPASSPSSDNSTDWWLWVVVGIAAGLAVSTAAAGGLLLVRRRRRRRQTASSSGSLGAAPNNKSSKGLPPLVIKTMDAGLDPVLELPSSPASHSPPPSLGSPTRSDDLTTLSQTMWHTRVGVIEGLEIGDLLGKGSFGCCYKGRWKGAPVAVKVIEQFVHPGKTYDLSREPLLSISVSHPCIIQTYKLSLVCVRPAVNAGCAAIASPMETSTASTSHMSSAQRQAACSAGNYGSSTAQPGTGIGSTGSGRSDGKRPPCPKLSITGNRAQEVGDVVPAHEDLAPGLYQTWMILELADKGSLADAIAAGKFVSPVTGQLDLAAILLSLIDIAHGMDYLHNLNIVHGDLKSRNVLLKSARSDRRGFVCKLADFGLSRMLGDQSRVDTASYGTATHAAPELLEHGLLTKAADVWSFGIIVWELVAGEEAYTGMLALQIIVQVTQRGYRLPIPEGCPATLAHLMQRCWDDDSCRRPGFGDIAGELREMLRGCRKQMSHSLSTALE